MGRLKTQQLLKDAVAAQRRGLIADAKRLYASVLKIDPENASAYGNLAIIAAQQGDLVQAEQLLRRAIALQPDHAANFHNLGLVLSQQGSLAEAMIAHRRAIELKPAYAEAHFALGNVLKQQGSLPEAVDSYGRAIASRAAYPEAYNNIGVALQSQGKRDEAIAAYRKAIELQPTYAEARFNLGVVLHEASELTAAETAYREVLKLRADIPLVHNNLGTVLQELGRLDEAIAAFDRAIELTPAYADAHYNRGVVLQLQGRLDDALAAYGHAAKLRPDDLNAINRSGVVLQQMGRAREAVVLYRGLLQPIGNRPDLLNNFAAALLTEGLANDALAALRQALALRPDFAEAFYNAGNAWRELGNLDEAIAAYREACRLRPDYDDAIGQLIHHRWRACDWQDYEASCGKLLDMVARGIAVPPFYLLAAPSSPADQLTCARQWISSMLPPARDVFSRHAQGNDKRIRIGYLSGDFHQHATAHLIAELFELHDRERFEIVGYSYGPSDHSAMRARIERGFDEFVDVSKMSHREAAERIHTDEIGILIDLKGYTHRARPQIASYRPAPVQVSYLGYPATCGAEFIDYLIADRFVVPEDLQPSFSERLIYLPGCYQVNDRKREIAEDGPSREDCGLPARGFVFCSFNNSYKITPVFFDVWMRLLEAVPGSVLWLLETNQSVKRNLSREAASRGVESDRLVFAPIASVAAHLARHRHADLFLDTLPCNAHTTASDALWAGLPVLTCAGTTFAGRVAGSLLAAAGLPELIATSLEEYESKALQFAADLRTLAELRERLRNGRDASTLFDPTKRTRSIEAAYVRIWENWRAGRSPVAFSVDNAG